MKARSAYKILIHIMMLMALIYVAVKLVIGADGIGDQVDVLSALVMYLFLDKLYKDN